MNNIVFSSSQNKLSQTFYNLQKRETKKILTYNIIRILSNHWNLLVSFKKKSIKEYKIRSKKPESNIDTLS